MKPLISEQQFLLMQPKYPEKTPTDPYYYRVACRLADTVLSRGLLPGWPESVVGRLALTLTGYLQDVLTDAGLWRSFIEAHHRMYGRYLPFYTLSEDYIPHELNPEDVRFLTWYSLCMYCEDRRVWNPLDRDIERAAEALHAVLNEIYDDEDAPVPEEFHFWNGLELGNPEEADEMYKFGHWLFLHSYLMTPAFGLTLAEILDAPGVKDDMDKLRKALEEAMMEEPTGPLALYLREWLFQIFEGRIPAFADPSSAPDAPEHPYYTRFTAATGGSRIKFFRTYEELNRFFIDALGWEEGENLPALKESGDFVLLGNRTKGMLAAANVAKCIRMEGNPCYDPEFARRNAIDLLTVRGLCPGDLLHYLFEHDALPDARFPDTDDTRLVHDNRDFIARCYLQKYYRGD